MNLGFKTRRFDEIAIKTTVYPNGYANGYSLVELILGVGLMTVLSAIIVYFSLSLMKGSKKIDMSISRSQVINQIKTVLDSKHRLDGTDAISVSIKKQTGGAYENLDLYNCVCGINCTSIKTPYSPVRLYDSPVATTPVSPGFYDTNGIPCNAAAANCVIRVQTSFLAECAPDFTSPSQIPPLTCGTAVGGGEAEFISIIYTVDQNPLSSPQNGDLLDVTSGSVFYRVDEIKKGICP